MLEEKIIESIHIGKNPIDKVLIKKCSYLFYEIKTDHIRDGGYKIELSFEEKQANFCDISKITEVLFNEDAQSVGSNNQSILSAFELSNEKLMEMRRLMATKCTVNFNGTVFNIFKLVRMINAMKAKTQGAGKNDE